MNYNKLWKLLIDKKLRKKDLREMAGLSTNVIAKMGKGGDVSTQVLRKICEALDCKIEDIVCGWLEQRQGNDRVKSVP